MGQLKPVFLRAAFNYDADLASHESGLTCDDLSLTVQSEAEDADINVLVKRFGLTGQLPTDVRVPMSGDFTGVSDYQTALNLVLEAEASFMQMPADVRARFGHDPQQLISFVENSANRDEAIRLGLVVPKAAPVDAGVAPSASTATPSPGA